MVTEELTQDSYIRAQQESTLVDKYRSTHQYVGTISASPNYHTNEVPVEELQALGAEYTATSGTMVAMIIRHRAPLVLDELLAYQSESPAATLPKVVREKGFGVYTIFRRSDTATSSWSIAEELKELLRRPTQEPVEVYPGYLVSSEEYQRRFKGVNLDYFRKVLPPELFKAYVRSMGSVEGWGVVPENMYKGKD